MTVAAEVNGTSEKVTVNYYSDGTADTRITTKGNDEIWFGGVAPVETGHGIRATGKYVKLREYLSYRHPDQPHEKLVANVLVLSSAMLEKEILQAKEILDTTADVTYAIL